MRIDGTEYQTVSSESRIHVASSTGKSASCCGTSTTAAPAFAAANRSKTERSKWSGAWLERRSSSVTPNSSVAQSTKAIALRWESMTPFGTPVDPDV